jgi:hypothetical protein
MTILDSHEHRMFKINLSEQNKFVKLAQLENEKKNGKFSCLFENVV